MHAVARDMPVSASLAAAETPRFAVIGLGYVGLPLAVAFGRHWPTLGFDIDADRIAGATPPADSPGLTILLEMLR